MYKGYNLVLSNEEINTLDVTDIEIQNYEAKMNKQSKKLFEIVASEVEKSRNVENEIDGSKLINNWFPNYQADVFISHSHADIELAKKIASWLNREFGLVTFIDSVVWENISDMLRNFNDEYCMLEKNNNGQKIYDYDKANFMSSHIYMMLSTALNDMIYSTECIMFLNTPNSLTINDIETKKTASPWIYNELKTSVIVEKIYPRAESIRKTLKEDGLQHSYNLSAVPQIEYDVNKQLATFKEIKLQTLLHWKILNKLNKSLSSNRVKHSLDSLYSFV